MVIFINIIIEYAIYYRSSILFNWSIILNIGSHLIVSLYVYVCVQYVCMWLRVGHECGAVHVHMCNLCRKGRLTSVSLVTLHLLNHWGRVSSFNPEMTGIANRFLYLPLGIDTRYLPLKHQIFFFFIHLIILWVLGMQPQILRLVSFVETSSHWTISIAPKLI